MMSLSSSSKAAAGQQQQQGVCAPGLARTEHTHPPRTRAFLQVGKAFYSKIVTDAEYQGPDYEEFDQWLGSTVA